MLIEKKFTSWSVMDDFKFLFKVVLVGNAGVGKTCLVRRFTQGLFPPGQGATIGVDFMIKTVQVDNEKVKVNWSCKSLADRPYFGLTYIGLMIYFFTAANMGHCGSGTISFDYAELLQICTRINFSIRHILSADIRLLAGLVERNRRICERQSFTYSRR